MGKRVHVYDDESVRFWTYDWLSDRPDLCDIWQNVSMTCYRHHMEVMDG